MKSIDPEFMNARDRLLDLMSAKEREREAVEILRSATQSREFAEKALANALSATIGDGVEAEANAAIRVALKAQAPAMLDSIGSN